VADRGLASRRRRTWPGPTVTTATAAASRSLPSARFGPGATSLDAADNWSCSVRGRRISSARRSGRRTGRALA